MNSQVNKQNGFSLLEILIAFSILALSLGILLKIFSAGVNSAGVAEEYTAAIQIAQSAMAAAGVESPLQGGDTAGLMHKKYHWQVAVEPFQFAAANIDMAGMPATLFKVIVTVNWNGAINGRQIQLITLKLANKPL